MFLFNLGKTLAITILFSRAYPEPKEIEHDYRATTSYHLDLYKLKEIVDGIHFVVYQNKALKPRIIIY
jgi:hypothetical protein